MEYLYFVISVCSDVECNTLNFDSRRNIDNQAMIEVCIGRAFFDYNRITPITSRDRYTPWPFCFEAKSQLLLGWGCAYGTCEIYANRG